MAQETSDLINFPMELTSTRVDKGNVGAIAPKIIRGRRKVEIMEPANKRPKVIEPIGKILLPVEPPKPQPILKANLITPPVPVPKPISTPVVNSFDEETSAISDFSISSLIQSKFKRGKPSSFDLNRTKSSKTTIVENRVKKPQAVVAPQFKMVNGIIALDKESLQITQDIELPEMEIVEEEAFRKDFKGSMDSANERTLFSCIMRVIKGLSCFGTNFELLSLMFPGLSRKHLKLKFQNEEARNPKRITNALHDIQTPDHDLLETMKLYIEDKKRLHYPQFTSSLNPQDVKDAKKASITNEASEPLNHSGNVISESVNPNISPAIDIPQEEEPLHTLSREITFKDPSPKIRKPNLRQKRLKR